MEVAALAKDKLYAYMAENGTSEGYEGPNPRDIALSDITGGGGKQVTSTGLVVEIIEE